MRAIAPRCCAAAAAPIRREIVAGAGAVAGVFVRLPFVLPLRRRRRPFHPRLLSAATASPIMGSLNKKEQEEEEVKEKGKAPASSQSQSQSQSQSLPPPPQTQKQTQTQKQKQKQLQPPEKPLPGDCCGSGCVRCVWDVYYEELEAYQKTLSSAASNTKDN